MDLFSGIRGGKAQGSKRVREIQELIRTFAGELDEDKVDTGQVREMMQTKGKEDVPVPVTKAEPVLVEYKPIGPPKAPVVERPVFCKYCGSRLPEDGSACLVCGGRKPIVRPVMTPVPEMPRPMPEARPAPAPSPPPMEKATFCTNCGSVLPPHVSVCPRCANLRWRRCPSCGAWVRSTDQACPICHRVLPPEMGMDRVPTRYR